MKKRRVSSMSSIAIYNYIKLLLNSYNEEIVDEEYIEPKEYYYIMKNDYNDPNSFILLPRVKYIEIYGISNSKGKFIVKVDNMIKDCIINKIKEFVLRFNNWEIVLVENNI